MAEKQELGFIRCRSDGHSWPVELLEGRLMASPSTISMKPRLRGWCQRGAKRAETPAAVASAAEIVLASLPRRISCVRWPWSGPGVIGGSKIKTFIDLSTTGPVTARKSPRRWPPKALLPSTRRMAAVPRARKRARSRVMVAPSAQASRRSVRYSILSARCSGSARKAGMGRGDETRQQHAVGERGCHDLRSVGHGRQGRARRRHHDRRHQLRQRPQHGDRGQIPALRPQPAVRLRFRRRPDAQGCQARRSSSASRSACR